MMSLYAQGRSSTLTAPQTRLFVLREPNRGNNDADEHLLAVAMAMLASDVLQDMALYVHAAARHHNTPVPVAARR